MPADNAQVETSSTSYLLARDPGIPQAATGAQSFFRELLPRWLLIGSAFFITWGDGLQKTAEFDFSKIFVACSTGLILHWAIFSSFSMRKAPKALKWLLIYGALHTLFALFLSESGFASWQPFYFEQELLNEFIRINESLSLNVIRYFYFVLFAFAVAHSLKSAAQLRELCVAMSLGLLTVIGLGGYSYESKSNELIHAMGYLDPNSCGRVAVFAFFIGLMHLVDKSKNLIARILFALFAITALCVTLMTSSRGAFMGLLAGSVIAILYSPRLRGKFVISLVLLACGAIVAYLLPDNVYYTRSRFARISEDRGSNRLETWEVYLSQIDEYVLTGVGVSNSGKIVEDSTVASGAPHNTYLLMLVEQGIIGFSLFLIFLHTLWRRLSVLTRQATRSQSAVMLGMLAAYLANFVFLDSFQSRDFCMAAGIIIAATAKDWRPVEPPGDLP
ncbi:MAG: O-antigen ligase family protein [Elusimicrobiota bacterium]|jgi:O-antigen ligase